MFNKIITNRVQDMNKSTMSFSFRSAVNLVSEKKFTSPRSELGTDRTGI